MRGRRLAAALLLFGLCGWACSAYLWWRATDGTATRPPGSSGRPGGTRGFQRMEDPDGAGRLAYDRRHALVVGVNHYLPGRFGDLDGPNHDAAEVAEVLALRYGFEEVDLLVDRKPATPLPPSVRLHVVPAVTRAALTERLKGLKERVGARDGLFFFYAGHGVRLGQHGYLAPADGDPNKAASLLDAAEAARLLRACDAHHTLLVLDCCFSGTALEPGGGLDEAVGILEDRSLRVGGADNLSRVFNRRAFQVITAGTGQEAVGDLAQLSREYATLADKMPGFRGHSPFTAVFLQALRGLTGRADGKVLASALGYYMNDALVNGEGAVEARQAPKYGALGGDGDFLFVPAYARVLNPRLLAPLYLAGAQYAELRRSACEALQQFIADQPEEDRLALARGAVTHLGRLLSDGQPAPRLAAARVLADLAQAHGKAAPELVEVRDPLVSLLKDRTQTKELHDQAARALGQLGRFADEKTAAAFAAHVEGLEAAWKEEQEQLFMKLQIRPEDFRLPQELQDAVAKVRVPAPPAAGASAAKRMEYHEALRQRWGVLRSEGLDRYVRRHEQGKTFVERAQQLLAKKEALAARLTAARALGFEGLGRPERDAAFARQYPTLLLRGSAEWEAAEKLTLEPSMRPVWASPHGAHHLAKAVSVACSPDGNMIASASLGGTVRLWDAATGKLRTALPAPGMLTYVAFSPDGKTLAAAVGEKVRLHDAATGKVRVTLAGHGATVTGIAFARDGKTVATASWDKTVRLWDAADGKPRATLTGHSGQVNGVAFAPDGKTVASAGVDQTVRFWDAADGKQRPTALKGHSGSVFCVAFSPDGKTVVSGGEDRTVRLWDAARGEGLSLEGHDKAIVSVAFSIDGKTVASAGNDDTVRLWDVASGKAVATLEGQGTDPSAVAFVPDGKRLAVAYGDGTVRLWDLASHRPLTDFGGHGAGINGVAFAPDGKTFASASDDGTVRTWDAATRRQLRSLSAHRGRVLALAWSPDGKTLVSAGADRVAKLWDAATGKEKIALDGHAGAVSAVAFAADGKTIATGAGDRFGPIEVKLWDAATGKLRASLPTGPRSGGVSSLAFRRDGTLLAGACENDVLLWDLPARKAEPRALQGHREPVFCVAFSPDGKTLASGSYDKTVRLWEVAGGKARTLEGHAGRVAAVAFSPDGNMLASASGDRSGRYTEAAIRLWDVKTGQTRSVLQGHRSEVRCIAFSPDGRLLASGGDDAVRLWDAGDNLRAKLETGTMDVVGALAVNPDGKAVAWTAEGAVRVRDLATGKLSTLEADGGHANGVAFCPKGGASWVLAVAGSDGAVRLWDPASEKAKDVLKSEVGPVRGVACSPGGELLAAAAGKSIVLWDLKTRRRQGTLVGHEGVVNAVAFSPDGKTLASVAGNLGDGGPSEVKLWSVTAGKAHASFAGNGNATESVAFSPDGKILATGGSLDTAILLWDARTGKRLGELEGYKEGAQGLAFSADGKTLAAGGADGNTVRLWDVAGAKVREVLRGHGRPVAAVAFSRDGKTLATFSPQDGAICLWDPPGAVDLTPLLRWFAFEDLDLVVRGPLSDTLLPGPKEGR